MLNIDMKTNMEKDDWLAKERAYEAKKSVWLFDDPSLMLKTDNADSLREEHERMHQAAEYRRSLQRESQSRKANPDGVVRNVTIVSVVAVLFLIMVVISIAFENYFIGDVLFAIMPLLIALGISFVVRNIIKANR